MVQVLEQQIKSLVKKTVKETLRAELAQLRANALPLVPKEEMVDISRRYKNPSHRAARIVRVNF